MALPNLPGVSVTQIDGGPNYYGQWSHSFPTDPNFFPIGVWAENFGPLTDTLYGVPYKDIVDAYASMHINFFPEPYGADPTINTYFATKGMYWIGGAATGLSRNVANNVTDEPDWNGCDATVGDVDTTRIGPCYEAPGGGPISSVWLTSWADDVQAQDPTRPMFGQFTKIEKAGFPSQDWYINDKSDVLAWTAGFDIISYDWYPLVSGYESESDRFTFTQGDACATLRSNLNYAKPVFPFIETSEMGNDISPPHRPTVAEINHEIWSSIIAGARGIEYFNHNFGGGGIETTQVLLHPSYTDIRAGATATNAQILSLAYVINSPYLNGLLEPQNTTIQSVPGWRTMVKWVESEQKIYIFATPRAKTAGPFSKNFNTLTAIPASTVEVVGESRSLTVTNSGTRFTDTFATPQTVHIYRFDAPVASTTAHWATAQPKVWKTTPTTGWVNAPTKVWNGSAWVPKPTKVWKP